MGPQMVTVHHSDLTDIVKGRTRRSCTQPASPCRKEDPASVVHLARCHTLHTTRHTTCMWPAAEIVVSKGQGVQPCQLVLKCERGVWEQRSGARHQLVHSNLTGTLAQ